MKSTFNLALIVVLTSVLTSCCQCNERQNDIGRYVLFNYKYRVILDTKTGRLFSKQDGKTQCVEIIDKDSSKWERF
jgi:hypothetical protein